MQYLLRFVVVWGVYPAFVAGSIAILVWLLSIDGDPDDERVFSSELWAMFWPFIWLFYRLTGRSEHLANTRKLPSKALRKGSQTGALEQSEPRFRTVREAKNYLATRIAEEADRNGTPLTEVERKMLYFTESGWTLPDMNTISAEFDRDYDEDDYERKISWLINTIQSRMRTEGEPEEKNWDRALEKLSDGDHYLLVLVDAANPKPKGARYRTMMLIIGLVMFVLVALDKWFRRWLLEH